MITINNKRYFTPKEVAEMFSVNSSSVARWRQNGRIRSFALNKRKYLYGEDEIEAFIKRGVE